MANTLGKGQLVRLSEVSAVAQRVGNPPAAVGRAPLGEPIVQYGPFVMNSREEIEQALRDFRDGTLA